MAYLPRGAMKWRPRLPLLLLAVNLAFFTTTLLVQWRWRLPDDTDDFGIRTGSWAAAVHHGSRLWAAVKHSRKDYSVWSAVAAEAAGAANEGVKSDAEAVHHLRGAFQQRANVSAIQQAQHAGLQGSVREMSRHDDVKTEGVQASSNRTDGSLQSAKPASDGASDVDILDDELAGAIPGDGTGFRMRDPALIVFASARPAELQQTLESVSRLEGLGRFAVYISQDGGSGEVRALISRAMRTLRNHARKCEHWTHKPMRSHQQVTQTSRSQHYKFGVDRAFRKRGHSHVIVLEDNMQASPDFLLYFEAVAPLLEVDSTLWCISAWNDNSRAIGFRWDAKRMMRTSFFPGQGWLLRSQLWAEISSTWPTSHGDMRLPNSLHERDCVAPEVNRIRMLSPAGPHQQNMTWQTKTMHDWGDLSYLVKQNYEAGFRQLMQHAQSVPADRLDPQQPGFLEVPPGHVYLLTYKFEDYSDIARALHISPQPRAQFQNVALLPYRGSFFLLADARACPLLPKSWRVLPSVSMLSVAGQRGQSCSSVCSCKSLRQHFACELGCATGPGQDLPSYIADDRLPTFHQCLVARGAPLCAAQHAGALRLCPCVPRNGGNAGTSGTFLTVSKAAIIHPKGDQLELGLVAA